MVRNATKLLRAALALPFAVACLHATPFGTDTSVRDRTRTNIEALSRRTPGRQFKFVAVGDIQNQYDDFARTVDAINARNDIELVVVTGDLSDRGLLQEYEWSRELLDRLRVPYLTAVGNHELISSGKEIYQKMYGPFDYRVRFGGIEFVFFNSNALEFPGEPVPNFTWLNEQLSAATDARGVVLVTHHPPVFPGGKPEGDYDPADYERLFAQHNITLMVNGHERDWTLSSDRGAAFLTVGTFDIDHFHTIVTIDGDNVSFERCLFETCEPVATPLPPVPRL
jgi:hypothetical protein